MDMENEWGNLSAPVGRLADRVKGRGDAFTLEPLPDVELEGAVDNRLRCNRRPRRPEQPVPPDDRPLARDRH
jgi:hypothetical protein